MQSVSRIRLLPELSVMTDRSHLDPMPLCGYGVISLGSSEIRCPAYQS